MDISYAAYQAGRNSTLNRTHQKETASLPSLPPEARLRYPRAAALSLPCLTLQRAGWRPSLEDRVGFSPLTLSLYGCKKLLSPFESEDAEEKRGGSKQKLNFGVDKILSSEFGTQTKKFNPDKFWWHPQQYPSPSMLTSRGHRYPPSIHIPAETSYAGYQAVISQGHVDTPSAVFPQYSLEKCGYGYLSAVSPYGHLKQTHLLGGGHDYKGAPRRKKTWSRAVFTSLQRRGLEKRFEVQKYVNKPDRKQLASALGLTDSQVKVWFQNRRMKWRHSQRIKKQQEKAFPNSPHPELPD